ncbi:MAG TPA: amino acid adenylation domain-containing protein, partial [Longimicrobium sp.]|nr:amino acid adenylation domain-containing protein [Longimicrobium sp.]
MDVLAGQTFSAPLSVKVSTVRVELPEAEPNGGLPLSAEQLLQQAEYWRETLAYAPEPLELPADRPRPAQPDHAGAHVRLELDETVTAALRALGSRHGATLPTALLAGWAAVLGRLSGQTDLVIGTSTGSRERAEAEGLVGRLVNPLPVRVDLSGSPTAAELLGRVQARVQGALRNGDLPFERVVELVQPNGAAPSPAPLFRAAFAWRDAPVSGPEQPGLEPRPAAGLDLSLELREEGGGVAGEVVFAAALFDRETVERYAGYLRRMLAGMAAGETRPVDRLTLLSPEERRLVVDEWNRTEAPYPAGSFIHERFEAQAGRTPDAVAVVYEDRELTYGELNARANRLAHHLRSLGVGPDVRVGICVEREPELVVAIFGVLKAGGAYLPLDPGYPRERLLDMVQDSAPVVMLTQEALAGRLAGLDVPLLALDEDAAWWEGQPDTDPERAALTPENLTYVIYTSGSTGRPKGVEMTHRGASNLLHWYLGATGITERDAVLVVTSFSFHLTQRNLMAPLFVGGRVHLAREPFEPGRLAAQIVASGITMMNVTPTGFQALVEADGGRAIGGLRIVVFGGEPLYPRQLAKVPEPRPVFLNPYGSTEATGITTHHFARADLASYSSRSMPPGCPIANATIYVLDGAGEPVPVGVTGELYLGGAGVTRGYRRLPGQTAERFLPDPFGAEPGARLYRTGDLGRWLPDGTIEFMGRGDAQVKVRGFRIELGEIEARLAEHEAVHETVVVARGGELGDPRLVAYYTGDEVRAAALRAHLAERLPEYMVPAAFVHMDALPVNPNGKLDRKALPAPDFASSEDESYVAPRTPVEEVLAGIWAEVLGLERVGVEEGFFDRGGHSLLATRVVSRVREVFGVELPLRALFEGPTVAEMAGRVEEMRRAGLPVLPPVVPAGRTEPPALSFAQERLWFLDQLEQGSAFYNLPFALRLRGALDVEALERSLGEIVRRHEALRTVFREHDGTPVQVIAPFGGVPLPVKDLSHLPGETREAEVQRELVAEATARPFDLSAGPLFRASLLRLGAQEHVLLLSMHHIVSDGWSMGVLYRELSALYEAYREGRESPLPELPVQYADYALWQRKHLRDGVLEGQLAYWRARLADAPALLELPTDHPRPAVQTFRGATVTAELSLELLERLQALGRSEGATLYMTLLGAFQVLLSRYSGSKDVVVGSPIAGRTRKEAEELIGFFVNTLVLRTDLAGNPSFREVLRRVREVTLGAYEHQEVPFERLVAELQPERSLSHSPLFQVMFALQNAGGQGCALPGLETSEVGAELATARVDLSLVLKATAHGLSVELNYSTDLFERSTADRMLGHLERVLEQVTANADVWLSRLDLLGQAERALVLEAWNRTEAEYASESCIHELFEAQVERAPDALALACGSLRLSYAELNARANRLAHHLRSRGVGPDARVAISLERGPGMVVALLAVLKAGGAYVPLDPDYPEQRLRWMLEDSAPALLLTTGELAPRFAHAGVPLLDLADEAAWAGAPATDPERGALRPEHPAYVIYTSGSTGRPKGAMIQHRNVCGMVAGQVRSLPLEADSRILQFASFSFDGSVYEVFLALARGASLHLSEHPGPLAGDDLVRIVARAGITHAILPPAVLAALPHDERLPSIHTLIVSGDAPPVDLMARWSAGRRLINGYGPTEATVCTTLHDYVPGSSAPPPIGRPVANVRVYLLDATGEPVPHGARGELYVGGAMVGRGYWRRAALTAERFVPDPFGAEPGARLYRTGDLARWNAEGALEFAGRVDAQVKVRGFRVELGEIETRLLEHPAVREAVVVASQEEGTAAKRLVAYWVGGAVEPEALRSHLLERLPDHMVPAAYVHLPVLPLNPSGKVDRRALPAPEGDAFARRGYEAPLGEVETALAEIWSEVLGIDRVGRHDGFFELGGHSLLAVTLIARMRTRGLHADVRALFTTPTLAGLATAVMGESADVQVPPNRIPDGSPVITPEMLPLVTFSQAEVDAVVATVPGGAANVQDVYPLAPLQEGFLFHHLATTEGDPYLQGTLSRFATREQLDAHLEAFGAVIARHDILRTAIVWEGLPEPVQVVWRQAPLPVEEVELDPAAGDVAGQLYRRFDPRRHRIDVRRAPLLRCHVAREADGESWVLLLLLHHLGGDHTTLDVLREEIETHLKGRADSLPEPAPFRNFVAQARLGVSQEEHREFFTEMLGDVDEPTAPFGLLDVRGDGSGIEQARLDVDEALAARLRERARALGVSAATVCHVAWAQVLGRASGRDDVVFGTLLFGRMQGGEGAERVMGPFINTLPVRVRTGTVAAEAGVRQTHAQLAKLLRHEHAPLVLAQRCSAVDASAPLFTSLLNYRYSKRKTPASAPAAPAPAGTASQGGERTNYPLALSVDDLGDGFSLIAQAPASVQPLRVCEMMHAALESLVQALETAPGAALGRLDVLPEAERARVVGEWNRTDAEYASACIHELFERQVERAPGATAVRFGDERLSYAELNARANRLAHHLRSRGV